MVSAEDVIRSKAAKIARSALTLLPPYLASTVEARTLLQVATGEEHRIDSIWYKSTDRCDLDAMLFCFSFHVLGVARRLEMGLMGEELHKIPEVGSALNALRQALHRDLIRTQIETAHCVQTLSGEVEWLTLATSLHEVKIDDLVEKLLQDANDRIGQDLDMYTRKTKIGNPRKRPSQRSTTGDEAEDLSVNPFEKQKDPRSDPVVANIVQDLEGLTRAELQQLCRDAGLSCRDGPYWLDEECLKTRIAKRRAAMKKDEQDKHIPHRRRRKEAENTKQDMPAPKRRRNTGT